jgi:Iron-containing redox enzyme
VKDPTAGYVAPVTFTERLPRATITAEPSASLPSARGPLSASVLARLAGDAVGSVEDVDVDDPLGDDDLHLALYLGYELHYRGFDGVDDALEWDPMLLGIRASLERAFESALRDVVHVEPVGAGDVPAALREIGEAGDPAVAGFLGRQAEIWHYEEFLIHRSAYHLKEADPHSWAIPRITRHAKAALIEIQSDEYGGGDADRMHAVLFGDMMRTLHLDATYGAYLDRIPGETLATVNLMSLFGLHRRLRGSAMGHLAAFELGSARPNRLYGDGLRRLGYGADATRFFDEHVEADSVHDMIATYDLAGSLALQEPHLATDILFGALALGALDDRWADRVLGHWRAGRTSLRLEPSPAPSQLAG